MLPSQRKSPYHLFKCIPCSPTAPLREVRLLGFLEHLPSSDISMFNYCSLIYHLPPSPEGSWGLRHVCVFMAVSTVYLQWEWEWGSAHEKCSVNICQMNPWTCHDLERVNSLAFSYPISKLKEKEKETGHIKGLFWLWFCTHKFPLGWMDRQMMVARFNLVSVKVVRSGRILEIFWRLIQEDVLTNCHVWEK